MKFRDLYHFANNTASSVIPVKELARQVVAYHSDIGEVNFWAVCLDTRISYGHIKYERDRSSAYGDPFRVANIRFHKELNRCWRRFVCAKELMHVFDTDEERVNTKEKFLKLMQELESQPLGKDSSKMFESEIYAQWKAVLCLVPQRLRDPMVASLKRGDITMYDAALQLKVPEVIIPSITTDYYNVVKDEFLGE